LIKSVLESQHVYWLTLVSLPVVIKQQITKLSLNLCGQATGLRRTTTSAIDS